MLHLLAEHDETRKKKLPRSQKNHLIINLEPEQVKVMALFVNYQSLVQSQPAINEALYSQKH